MPGGGERAEGDGEHGERHRPGHDLGAQHRVLVLLVELRPEAGGARQGHVDPRPAAAWRRGRRRPAARTISGVPAAAPARTTTTRPFRAIDSGPRGGGTDLTAGSRRRIPVTRPTVARKAGLALCRVGELTTAMSA